MSEATPIVGHASPRSPRTAVAILLAAIAAGVLVALQQQGPRGEVKPLGKDEQGYLTFRDERDGSVMVWVPGGPFTMGSSESEPERPAHEVTLDGFYIDQHEVTLGRWKAFVAANPRYRDSIRDSGFLQTDDHPVVCVTWREATAYAAWAGKSLPTEAQWEKAARWDATVKRSRVYPWEGAWDPSRANFCDRSCKGRDWMKDKDHSDGFAETAPVGRFPGGISPWGAHDMAGNVAEWCRDVYTRDFYFRDEATAANAENKAPAWSFGDADGGATSMRVIRGGHYADDPQGLRAARRDAGLLLPSQAVPGRGGHGAEPNYDSHVGFRCAATDAGDRSGREARDAEATRCAAAVDAARRARVAEVARLAAAAEAERKAREAEAVRAAAAAEAASKARQVEEARAAARKRGLAASKVEVPPLAGMTPLGPDESGFPTFRNEKDGAVMVWVPPGPFAMGSDHAMSGEKPRHRRVIARGFFIGRTETTWAQYLAFCAATGRAAPQRPPASGDDHPVVNVDWADADAYCRWMGGSLPSEAQWEKAARGIDGRKYPWGFLWDGAMCNHGTTGSPWQDASDGFALAAPVGSYPQAASPVGVLDMAGNVCEWCDDWYDPESYARYMRGDKSSPGSGERRAARGGSWYDDGEDCQSTFRYDILPASRRENLGFRPVRVVPE